MVTIKSEREIELMRKARQILGNTLKLLEENVKPGITTAELDKIAYEYIKSNDSIPSFKGYNGFPASICASVNNEVVHGIPDNRVLREGDIVGIDAGVCYGGYHADAARTFGVGEISPAAKKLIEVTKESFFKGVEKAKHGARIGDISAAVQTFVEGNGYSVVRDLIGHGIGSSLHEEPDVPNYGTAGRGT
ncbi:MAG: type I methionyl aminopeptidase, partial [Clostridia bacterium]|nr:type I methionyl aminopeptidase [Clostridia bacterium]